MITPAPAPTSVGQEVPASGRAGSSVSSGVGDLVAVGFGVAVDPPTGGAVVGGAVVGGAVVGGAVVGGAVVGGAVVGGAVVRVKERAVQAVGTFASGIEVGTFGATGCCLN